ncbi:PREDICTED: serine protease inhibitor dipetalogastin-like [Nicrophorus vespilloides]|uniref:Serine protease inhibitor dipetalogastin-like n=1 Tax=Nicrophorus vespilloides TaxID=110193 RepID=A0ABM1M2L3_NICVS|nr:PREDICTED: serine protease inhibitor dipetalogastin-like [Nicrophorus vespilloides]
MKFIVAVLFAIFSVAMATEICKCPDIYEPVCDSDLTTHANLCDFECEQRKDASLELLHAGECVPEDNCICIMLYDPVWDTNGTRYGNMCMFECAKRLNPSLKIA